MLHPRSRGTIEYIAPTGEYTNDVGSNIALQSHI